MKETEYNGTLFRSEVEARWAVFFDALAIPYNYEPEGFDLGDQGWFVPTFWLPSLEWFVHIEEHDGLEPESEEIFDSFCVETAKKVVVFNGAPTLRDHDRYSDFGFAYFYTEDEDGLVGGDTAYWFCCCPHCKRVGIEYCGRSDRIPCKCPKSPHGDKGYNYDDPFLVKAYEKAFVVGFKTSQP